jgi:hypothetical protein
MLKPNIKYSTIINTMDIIRTRRKWKHWSSLEKYHIYLISRDNIYMNEIYIAIYNPEFKTLYRLYTR